MTTELPNPETLAIDRASSAEIVAMIQREDALVAAAVGTQQSAIAEAIDLIAVALAGGGRLVYLGAGTSGRLGVLDASECPPTFSTAPETVVRLIAGGPAALTRAIEGAEDDEGAAVADLCGIEFCSADVLVGIATSGGTPYVLSGVRYARSLGAVTVGITCNAPSALHDHVDVMIAPVVGPEVIAGSTRMKAGTATKMVLNMLTTGAMIRWGKVYGNLMVDMRATNAKLRRRCVQIVCRLTDLDESAAQALLSQADGQLKTAIVAARCGVSIDQARARLVAASGHLRLALEQP